MLTTFNSLLTIYVIQLPKDKTGLNHMYFWDDNQMAPKLNMQHSEVM